MWVQSALVNWGVFGDICVYEREQMLHLALGAFLETVIAVLLSLVGMEGKVKTVSALVGVVTDRYAFYFTYKFFKRLKARIRKKHMQLWSL